MKGKDAHLAQTRDRVFYMLVRPAAGKHDTARMHEAMAHARELLAHAKSQAAYTSVREATANIPDSRGERREFFTSVGRNRSAKQVFSMDGPAPTTRHNTYWRNPGRAGVTTQMRPCDATQDPHEHARSEHLPWQALRTVHGFPDSYQWPEPQEGEVTAYAQFLANAVAPAMADLVGGIALQSGLLHDITQQASTALPSGVQTLITGVHHAFAHHGVRLAEEARCALHAKAATAPTPADTAAQHGIFSLNMRT